MTAKELIGQLQQLSEADLNKEIVIFDCVSYCTPFIIKVLDSSWGKRLQDKILID